MGILSRVFGPSDKPSNRGPTTVRRDGLDVIDVGDTFPITGRGLVVTGRLQAPVAVDEWLDVLHDGAHQNLRLARITVNDEMVDSAAAGTDAALLLAKPGIDSSAFII